LTDEIIDRGAKRVFIASIAPLSKTVGELIDQLQAKGLQVLYDDSIVAEPSFADFNRLLETVIPFQPDTVVGIGGGSVLDVAKLVAAQIDNTQTLREYVGNGLLAGRKATLICVPATSGTGSEVSPNAILVDDVDDQKKGIISPWLVPDAVFVDPVLTHSVPPAITAATGMDALTHCIEAYTNKFATPFIDLFALEGVRLIAAHIETAVKEGGNAEAREKVALGSLYGGFCLGPVNTAGVHALSYPLGSMYHLAHGLSNALLLPYVMEFNIAGAAERYADIAIAMGCSPLENASATALAGVQKIRQLNAACGVPKTLEEVGVSCEAIPQMAADAMKIERLLKNNPRPIHEPDAIAIYNSAFA